MKLIFSYEMKLWQTFVSYIAELEFNGPVGKIEIIVKGENEIYDYEWQWENNSADVDVLVNDKQADSIDEVKAAMTGAVLVPEECHFCWLYNTEKWSDRDIVEDLRNVVDERIELKALTIEDGEASWDIPKEAFEGILFGYCSDMIENYEDYEDEEDDDDDTESDGKRVIKLTDANVEGWAEREFGKVYDEEDEMLVSATERLKMLPENVVLDTSELTDFSGLFSNWWWLKEAPVLDTSKGKNFNDMFSDCYSLINVPKYDLSQAVSVDGMFDACENLEHIPDMIINPEAANAEMFRYSGIDEYEISEFLSRCKREAAQAGDDEAQLELGVQLWNEEEYTEGFFWMEKAAEQGNIDAMNFAASMSQDVSIYDLKKMVYWAQKILNSDEVHDEYKSDAMCRMGDYYADESCDDYDLEKALVWYKKSLTLYKNEYAEENIKRIIEN